MRKFLVSVSVAAVMLSSAAFGQGSQNVTQEQIDEFMNMYFDQFSSAASGRYMDDRCLHLPNEEHDRLVNNLAAATSWLETFVDDQALQSIDVGARQIGMDAVKFPCGPETEKIVSNSVPVSRNLATIANDALANAPVTAPPTPTPDASIAAQSDLTEEQVAQVERATEAIIQRFRTTILGWSVEQKCRHLGDTLDAEFDSNKTQIENYVRQLIVFSALQDISREVEAEANGPSIPACGRETFDLVENSFRISRQFLAYLKQLPW